MTMFDLTGRIAVVTGGNGGIGLGMARGLAAAGAGVVVAARNGEKAAAALAALGSESAFIALDVADENSCRAMIAQAADRFGRVDVLVNNAAVLHLATIDMTTVEAFERVLRVNCIGPFIGVRTVLPLMRANGGGSIVNIGSIDSVTGTSLTAAYTTSKFGIRGFTKVIALENRRFGIRANVVCPAAGNPEMEGMGTTLVAATVMHSPW